MWPRTKHVNIKYHHFLTHVAAGVDLKAIRSIDQPADIFTKPLTESVFALHRQAIMGWGHVPKGKDQAMCLVTKSLQLPPYEMLLPWQRLHPFQQV
jgi:hypothetical protein